MRSDSGFSTIELLVTIGILGVLTALAVPSFQSSLQKNRASGFANDLGAALNLARSEAIKRGVNASVCTAALYNSNTVVTDANALCDATVSWTQGWLVFVDNNGNGVFDSANAEHVLKVDSPINTSVGIVATANAISFLPTGGIQGGATQTLTITVGTQVKVVSVNSTGRISIK